MGDESLIITIVGAIVTTIISTVILRSMKFFEKRQDVKSQEVKEAASKAVETAEINAAKIAEELLKKQEERTNTHMKNTAKIASDLKSDNETRYAELTTSLYDSTKKIASELEQNTARIASELRLKTDEQSRDIVEKVTGVNSRLTKMIDSLKEGADMTNSNVANIRRDVLEMQEDIDDIYDKINREDIDKDPSMKAERDRKRKIRRKEINNDSLIYSEPINPRKVKYMIDKISTDDENSQA